MPIYEYRCSKCGFQDEYLRKASQPRLTVCPSCGKAKFEKLLSAAGFQLKGSGWYATDFKGGSKPAAAQAEGKAEAKGDATGEARGDTKSDSKSDGKGDAKSDGKGDAKSGAKSDSKTEAKSEAKTPATPAATTN